MSLDELPEFGMRVLEGLRQPMGDGVVTISRARGSYSFLPLGQLQGFIVLYGSYRIALRRTTRRWSSGYARHDRTVIDLCLLLARIGLFELVA